LTFSTVFFALFSAHISEGRKGEAFIGFFVVLVVLAWATVQWLFPALAAGLKTTWPSIVALALFSAVLVLSTGMSVRGFGPLRQTVAGHEARHDAEAAIFDMIIWFVFVLAGISLLKAAGRISMM